MSISTKIPRRYAAFKTAACVSTLAVLLALATSARAQEYDNFDSGALSGSWSTITSPNFPITLSFPTDVFGGKALRMQCGVPTTAAPKNPWGTARALAINTANTYTDFYVAADLVAYDTQSFDSTNYPFMGLIARETGEVASGTNFNGVALMYWYNVSDQSSPPESIGAMAMGYFVNGFMSFEYPQVHGGVVPAAVAYFTLRANHTYRLVFQGVGPNLTGSVYDTQDLTKPLGTLVGDTSLGNLTGLVYPPPTSGYSGLFTAYFENGNDDTNGMVDTTFDNFYAAATAPGTVTAPATPIGMIGAPQVTSHTPASWANFYNAASGMTINASTLSTPTITYFQLILNGTNVTAGATPSPALPATTTTITYNGLATNTVYDAVVILEDSLNRWTTNVWTFDTFSAAYLASASCINVECEDYDFIGGPSFPLPVPASGYSTNDNTWLTPPGASGPIGFYAGINVANGPATTAYGYVGQNGQQASSINAGPGEGDFYQCTRTGPLVGSPVSLDSISGNLGSLLPGCDYRTGAAGPSGSWPNFDTPGNDHGDVVGTARGSAYAVSIQNISSVNRNLTPLYTFDTKRAKYAALNTLGPSQYTAPYDIVGNYGATGGNAAPWWDVEEYNVVYTEGSDWLNYTHNWGAAQYYGVYLRAACALSQTACLYNGATLDPSSLIGTFSCTNALAWNWRFTPLRDANGSQAVVKLAGTSTLRLQVAPDDVKGVDVENGMAMNYMALVPIAAGSLKVTISPAGALAAGAQWQVDGGPLRNSGATVDLLAGTHTVSFTPALHYTAPATQQFTVTTGQTNTPPGVYTALPLSLWSTTQLKKSGTAWTQETGAIVDYTNLRVTNAAPAVSKYYQLRWDDHTTVTRVAKSGANVVLNFLRWTELPGLNIRAWNGATNTAAGTIDGDQFNLVGPSSAPSDSTPSDVTYFPGGLGTIGYATQSINMNGGPQDHFTAGDGCGVASPGPFPTGYTNSYSVEYRGLLSIATAGSYTFATTSDDGSALWLDAGTDNPTYSQAIVQNNYAQGMTTRYSTNAIPLTVGYHNIIIRYNQGGGGNGLDVQWDPAGGTSWVPIPGSLFYHEASQ